MIHSDATTAALEAVLGELEAAEDRAARAGHALAELEELAEGDPAAAAGLGAWRRRRGAARAGGGWRRPRSGWPRCGGGGGTSRSGSARRYGRTRAAP